VYQPVRIKNEPDVIDNLKKINPDFIVVVAYGQMLPKALIDIPKFGTINLHASLLPKYRGAAPINWAIINGEKESGSTIMFIDIGCDTGDMLSKKAVSIHDDMTFGELHDILMEDGAELLINTMKLMADGSIKAVKQNDDESTHAPMLNKENEKISWNKSAAEIKNLIRGLNPRPGAYTKYNNETMKIFEADVLDEISDKETGTILDVSKSGIKAMTGNKVLLIKKIQFPGGKPLMVSEYIKGHSINVGTKLED
ncbi:MAG: methionyl-tRNA formyltransferase, partial [Bacillota bacterium]|nr:methionyl-tRNA formyltransferase [Bacillota bacterium]